MQDEQASTIPGILATIGAGFDTVTGHLWLVLIPILLDIFYWIGPQLSSRGLLLELAAFFEETDALTEMANQLADVAEHTNLFTVLSVPYLGIPGLMAGFIMPEQTPVSSFSWEVSSPLTWLVLFAGLSFCGLLVATLYYGLVAWVVREAGAGTLKAGAFVRRLPLYWLRILGLALALLLLIVLIYIPLLLLATVIALFSPGAASLVMFAGIAVILWLVFYLSFSMHGILLKDRPVVSALVDSLRLVRRHWLPALSLFLLVLLVRNILSWLWLWVDTGSWLTVVSIAGYAFINTSLIAAMFIFYRDRYRYLVQTKRQILT